MKLTPLKCPHCGAKLKIAGNTVLTACQYCGNAAEFTGDSAIKLEQAIIKAADQPDILLPFWLVFYNARISNLTAYSPHSLFQQEDREIFLRKKDTSAKDIGIPSQMLVAAFRVNNFVNYTADLSHAMSLKMGEGPIEKKKVEKSMEYSRCYYDHLDAQGMVEVLLRVLANKKSRDILNMDFEIKWGQSRILWWPFKKDGDCWRDMLYEQRLLQSALEK